MIKNFTSSLLAILVFLLFTPFVFAADCETVNTLSGFLGSNNGTEWNYNNGIVWIGQPTGNCVTTSDGEACEFQIDDLIYGMIKYDNEGNTPANTDSTIWLNAFGMEGSSCFKNFEEDPDATGYLFASTYETNSNPELKWGSCTSNQAEFESGYYLRDCSESYFPIVNDSIYGLVHCCSGPIVTPDIENSEYHSITDVVASIWSHVNRCNQMLDVFEECKVEDCQLYFRYGIYGFDGPFGIYGLGYDIFGTIGFFSSFDLEEDTIIPYLRYTPWIAMSDSPQNYYDELNFKLIPTLNSSCEIFYSAQNIETCTDDAIKSTDTLYFEVDQNTMAEFDLTPTNNSCVEACLLDYSVDKLGAITKGDGCLMDYTPGNDFCGEEHLTFYYINDEGEVVSQCAVINVVCDPVEFDVYFDGNCDKTTGDFEPFFATVGLEDGQVIEWRLCDSDEWAALDFVEIDSSGFATASPGFVWGYGDTPYCIQYRDPENPNAIVTWGPRDACIYFPLFEDNNIDVGAEFICNSGAEMVTTVLTLTPNNVPFGKILWEYCECPGTLPDPSCEAWNSATEIGGGAVMIELPLHSYEEDICIKIVDTYYPAQIIRKDYGPVDVICQKSLAIDLVNFEGRKLDNANELVWNVATEKNNDYYILEKSQDGIHFSELAKIKSQRLGNQSMTYDYKDMNPDHINYYRLVAVDEMGNEDIVSEVIRIEQDKLINLTVFPNPTTGKFEIEYKSDAIQDIQLEVFDITGKLLIVETLETSVGVNNCSFDIDQYPNGTYIVKIIDRGAIFVIKVLKN